MEPIRPDLRAALKEAHPGLTDQEIDRAEELLVERMSIDPQKEPERIASIDRERQELIRRTMPRFAQVTQALKARRQTKDPAEPQEKVQVELKKTPR